MVLKGSNGFQSLEAGAGHWQQAAEVLFEGSEAFRRAILAGLEAKLELQGLNKRVAQLQSEKAAAVRVSGAL